MVYEQYMYGMYINAFNTMRNVVDDTIWINILLCEYYL